MAPPDSAPGSDLEFGASDKKAPMKNVFLNDIEGG
jgi:hypothetical protein